MRINVEGNLGISTFLVHGERAETVCIKFLIVKFSLLLVCARFAIRNRNGSGGRERENSHVEKQFVGRLIDALQVSTKSFQKQSNKWKEKITNDIQFIGSYF